MKRTCPLFFVLFVLAITAFSWTTHARREAKQAQPSASPASIISTQDNCEPTSSEYKECAPATKEQEMLERSVLDQVRAGRTVKLSQSAYKTLRGCFVRNLLTTGIASPQVGIVIDGAVIEGPIDIRNGNIAYQVELTHCTFLDDVNLKRSHFSKGLSFAGSQFGSSFTGPGRLDTESAVVDCDLNFEDCTFDNCLTFFKNTKVGVDWSLRRAKFAGEVNFTGINVGSNFFADKEDKNDPQTQFLGEADFEAAKVGLNAGFSNVTFDGYVNFAGAEFDTFSVKGSSFNGGVSFRGTRISDFYLCETDDTHPAARFKKDLTIEDMTVGYMSPEDWNELEEFADKSNGLPNQSSYNAQFYANLEAQFRRHGRPDQADEIYIAGMQKERHGLDLGRKAVSYFLDKFIGYGRHLERLLYFWSPLFLIAGCIIFWSEANMETRNPADSAHYQGRYRAGWYVLDLFLPIINLGEADAWTPKQRWRIWWKHVHRIVGNLFVPIGLAALTGIIK